jgi:hypothetical protein
MKKRFVLLSLALLLSGALPGSVSASTITLINENFSSGLGAWTISENVSLGTGGISGTGIVDDFAKFGSSTTPPPAGFMGVDSITRTVSLDNGYDSLFLSFDWYFDYSPRNANAGPDVLVSIMTDCGTPILSETLDTGTSTSLEDHGTFNSGLLAISDVPTPPHSIVVTFRLTESNGNNENSWAGIDNISLLATTSRSDDPTAVPEPTTLLLLGTGFAGLALLKFRGK